MSSCVTHKLKHAVPGHSPQGYEQSSPFVLHLYLAVLGGGPRVVVSTAAFHARVRGLVPGLGGLKETKMFLPHPRVKVSIVGSLRDREVACSASDRQGSNFESCVWRTVSSQSSHHPQEVLLAQFSLYVHKGGLKPDSFHFISLLFYSRFCSYIFTILGRLSGAGAISVIRGYITSSETFQPQSKGFSITFPNHICT